MIKIKKKKEINLSSINWTRLQEKKVIVEIDQGKLIGNQTWYKTEIMALMLNNTNVPLNKQYEAKASHVKKNTVKKIDKNFLNPKDKERTDEFVGVRSAFTKKKAKQVLPFDTSVL